MARPLRLNPPPPLELNFGTLEKNYINNVNSRKFESFQLRYFETLELRILKSDIFFYFLDSSNYGNLDYKKKISTFLVEFHLDDVLEVLMVVDSEIY